MQVKIYTDGAARGNPDGPGGYGTVLEYVDSNGELQIEQCLLKMWKEDKLCS